MNRQMEYNKTNMAKITEKNVNGREKSTYCITKAKI